MAAFSILHTNDFHGALTPDKAATLQELRKDVDLYFDCGDCLKTGNLGIPLRDDPAWDLLHRIGCDASVLGNRETHLIESAFWAKIRGAKHPIVCANLYAKGGGRQLPESVVLEVRGVKLGVFGVMVPMVTETMAAVAASAFVWRHPIREAERVVRQLRPNVDVLIALTHIGFSQDKKLAAEVEGIDLVLGGHSHTVLEEPHRVGKTWICQTGSHGRFVGHYKWDQGLSSAQLIALPKAATMSG